MEFTISRHVAAPPDFVVEWWLAHGPGRDENSPDLTRTSRTLPTGQLQIVLEGTVGSRRVRHDGVLTRETPGRWSYRTEVWSNGRLIVREQANSEVRTERDGARLTCTYFVTPVGALPRFAFGTGAGRLRRQREEAFALYLAALERAYAAARREA
ncbi:MAG: hypothetical protein ACREDK_04075 [Thermoplasmata archaeon]